MTNIESNPDEKDSATDKQNFSSSFDPVQRPLKNKKIQAITENFNIEFSADLTSLVGRIFEIQFKTINFMNPLRTLSEGTSLIFGSFQVVDQPDFGLITLDQSLLHKIICFLYGSDGQLDDDMKIIQFGKCSLKIAAKIQESVLQSLEKSFKGVHDLGLKAIDTSNHSRSIRTQHIPEKAYQISFNVHGMGLDNTLNIFLPERLIEQITYEDDQSLQNTADDIPQASPIQNDIIDSSVDLVALLPDIKLKLSDIMKLKAGDLIPIGNPEQVDIKLGESKTYKAIVGQSSDKKSQNY